MPHKKLTGTTITGLKPLPGEAQTRFFDSAYPGLCLRVGARDKAWAYMYRFDGKLRYKTLGKYAPGRIDHMDRSGAIAAAEGIQQSIEVGLSPSPIQKHVKLKHTAANPNAFQRRVKQYLRLYERQVRPATFKQAKRLLTGPYVASLTHSDTNKITRSQIVKLLEDMKGTPTQANRLQAYLGRFFGWCWDREYCEPSPMVGLRKRFKERPRKRHLDADEIKDLWNGCIDLGYPLGDWCRFTLATGQRPGECQNLNRNDLHNGIWLVEGGDPKNDERHRIPLPKIARDIIKKSKHNPYLFTTTDGDMPFARSGKPYGYLYEAAGLEHPWRPHDLRRTFQTIASEELDIEPYLLGAICNQVSVSKPGVAAVYNKASWIKQKKAALEKWNRWPLEVVK